MRSSIAVATVSGKAYYLLVNELKRRNLSFLSLLPGEPVPPSIGVVITTSKEQHLVEHHSVLDYNAEADPSIVVDEAVRMIQNEKAYEEVVVGVDPGKTFGIAVLADGKVLRKNEGLALEMAIDALLVELKKTRARFHRVRIGNGVPELAQEVATRLDIALPDNVNIEMVSEAGTSTLGGKGSRRKMSDAESAAEIARKRGNLHPRRKEA